MNSAPEDLAALLVQAAEAAHGLSPA